VTLNPITAPLGVSERRLLLLISAVQFVNILDFMMVMPLGPDFARELHISLSHLGWIGGSYTAAAAVSSLAAARFLDRFDRRSALALAMLGLVIGTACGGFAQGLSSLMLARIVAGAFGGPATSLSLSIIADVIPPERRGRALGVVMGAFSVASVLGVPAGLELARLGGWRLPFFALAGMGLLVTAGAIFLMPRLRLHLAESGQQIGSSLRQFLSRQTVLLAFTATFTVMMAAFAVIPNISSYVQGNLAYPRDRLGVLYLAGGTVSFVVMRLIGSYIDRFGAAVVSALGTTLFVAVLGSAFVYAWPLPVPLIFVAFMTAMALRNVSLGALSSRVPAAHERARFMSIQSAVQHIASALGAIVSAQLLHERADRGIDGMPKVASLSIGLSLALPVLLQHIERQLQAREARPATLGSSGARAVETPQPAAAERD
jgi:predicted MFS family arabinose efflux permease